MRKIIIVGILLSCSVAWAQTEAEIKDFLAQNGYFVLAPQESRFKLNYTTFVDMANYTRLPKLQSEYAQGSENCWHGADENEIFSWGPKISNLEYDGSHYLYDIHGKLVPTDFGNGLRAKTFNPTNFFQTAFSQGNTLGATIRTRRANTAHINLGQQKSNSPIPLSYKEQYNTSLLVELNKYEFKSNVGVLYNSSYHKMNEQGANLATLLHSVLSTPPTFDNTNAMSHKLAVNNNRSWLLGDGTDRSYAKDLVNNPYMLINNLSGREKNSNLFAYANTGYYHNSFTAKASFSYEKEWEKRHNGIMKNPFYHVSYRDKNISNIIATADAEYRLPSNPKWCFTVNYAFNNTIDRVFREDSPELIVGMYQKHWRNTHNISYGAQFIEPNYNVTLLNSHYFSTTLKNSVVNLFPKIITNINFNNIGIYAFAGRSISESDLILDNPSVISTLWRAKDFRGFYEYTDILNIGVNPEIYFKRELSIKYGLKNNRFTTEINGFYNNTHDFVYPVFNENSPIPRLNNIGRLQNYGYNINLLYQNNINGNLLYTLQLNFSQARNKVSAIYSNQPFLRLAGFADIATVFAEGKPFGAIYGTSYLRNHDNQIIVDNSGFPIVNNQIRMIGDPTPDFTLTLSPSVAWKKLNISAVMEYSHGGDRWNGTRAVLNYQGISEESGQQRNTKNHIFEGVDISGNQNTMPVDFYNPNEPISQNRWVRYGAVGVGEEYIEKASFFRLSKISLSYEKPLRRFFNGITITASAHNLLLISPYKGTSPSSLLFGNNTAKGLDMFNLPSVRSFSLSISFVLFRRVYLPALR